MDPELKGHLEAMESRLKDFVKAEVQGVEDRTAALVIAEVSSLRGETQRGFEHVEGRLESIDARLKVQAGLIQAGARAMVRFSEYT